MNFNKHSSFEGQHAFLGASNYHWLNYDEDKLTRTYFTQMAKVRGTKLHELACNLIRLGVRLPDSQETLNMYVNDAIDFNMTPEQVLYYSPYSFGTADAISFKSGMLRIHDLKTGVGRVSMKQPEIYAALFCLEYDVKPNDIYMELRIYQSNKIASEEPDPDEIFHIMDKIVTFDQIIQELRMEDSHE